MLGVRVHRQRRWGNESCISQRRPRHVGRPAGYGVAHEGCRRTWAKWKFDGARNVQSGLRALGVLALAA